LEPSPQARAWGKRQAARSPRWSDAKWNRIATLMGVTFTPTTDQTTTDTTDTSASQTTEPTVAFRDAA